MTALGNQQAGAMTSQHVTPTIKRNKNTNIRSLSLQYFLYIVYLHFL